MCCSNMCGEVLAGLLSPLWRGYQSCGEITLACEITCVEVTLCKVTRIHFFTQYHSFYSNHLKPLTVENNKQQVGYYFSIR